MRETRVTENGKTVSLICEYKLSEVPESRWPSLGMPFEHPLEDLYCYKFTDNGGSITEYYEPKRDHRII